MNYLNQDEIISNLKANKKYVVKNIKSPIDIYKSRSVKVFLATPKGNPSKRCDGWSIIHHIIRDLELDQSLFLHSGSYSVFSYYVML